MKHLTTQDQKRNPQAARGTIPGRLYTVVAPEREGTAETFFAALHGLLRPAIHRWTKGQPHVSLEIGGSNGQTRFYIWIARGQEPFIEDQLRAAYPGVELRLTDEDPFEVPHRNAHVALSPVTLSRSTFLPINTEIDGDGLAPLLQTLARPRGGERIHVSLLVRPRANGWQASARTKSHRLRKGGRGIVAEALLPTPRRKPAPTAHQLEHSKLIYEKASELGFDCALRVLTVADSDVAAREFLRSVAAAFRVFEGRNGFVFRRPWRRERLLEALKARRFLPTSSFILTPRELAALWHLPAEAPPHVEAIRSPKLPPASNVPNSGRVVGVSTYPGHERPVALSISDSRRHLHVLGPTGAGKTTLLVNLALQDLAAGRGVGIIDPKGDLVDGVLASLPRERAKDVVLITPSDADISIGLNPLEWSDPDDRDLIAENALSIFKRIYERHWGMRTDDILKSALLTLLARNDATLCHIPALLTDPGFRAKAIQSIDDPIGLGSFWRWYESLSDGQRVEAIGPVLNKLRDFLLRPRIRRLLCQPRSTVDLGKVLDGRGVLLVNLSTGRWGETTAALIGSFLFAKIWQRVRMRAAVTEAERPDFFLYVDEFQQFLGVAQSFADTLAQARSFRLSLTLANQHLGQLPRELREAISSNARSRIVFQCGQDDARYLAREFSPLDAEALQTIPRYEMAARLSIDGETSRAFTARALGPAPTTDPTITSDVAHLSRMRYGRSAREVDAELQALLEPRAPEGPDHPVGRRPRR